MAQKKVSKATTKKTPAKEATATEYLRQPAEEEFCEQIEALIQNETSDIPASWQMSPKSVLDYVVGGKTLDAKIDGKKKSVEITQKFFGDTGIVERAIVTLASERALLLVGEPGTGKSWLSEHLAAAISGNSTLTIQGTAGTTEDSIKYSWNVARVIAEGPTTENLIPSPTLVAMKSGGLLRFEEITRCIPDVQDSLVSILSDKTISIPELPAANNVRARSGFNVIATANTRDQGVNDLSAALKRRFNYIYIPIVADKKTEVQIVQKRSAELLERYDLPLKVPKAVIELVTTAFREMRDGQTAEGIKVKQPSTTLSTAEAIAVTLDAALHCHHFGNGKVSAEDVAKNIYGSVVKEDQADAKILKEYATLVAKRRKDALWNEFYNTMMKVL